MDPHGCSPPADLWYATLHRTPGDEGPSTSCTASCETSASPPFSISASANSRRNSLEIFFNSFIHIHIYSCYSFMFPTQSFQFSLIVPVVRISMIFDPQQILTVVYNLHPMLGSVESAISPPRFPLGSGRISPDVQVGWLPRSRTSSLFSLGSSRISTSSRLVDYLGPYSGTLN